MDELEGDVGRVSRGASGSRRWSSRGDADGSAWMMARKVWTRGALGPEPWVVEVKSFHVLDLLILLHRHPLFPSNKVPVCKWDAGRMHHPPWTRLAFDLDAKRLE